ncbi:hypothetical protein BHM03_00056931 [Ensete ventricosum]|nr:hypothetical protein BHM03_00056931 [Ensete ventricosum]
MMGQDQAWVSGRGSDDVVGPRREFARRFAEGIRKLVGNTLGDRRKKTIRLVVIMSEVTGLAGVRSWFSLLYLLSQDWRELKSKFKKWREPVSDGCIVAAQVFRRLNRPRLTSKPPVLGFGATEHRRRLGEPPVPRFFGYV